MDWLKNQQRRLWLWGGVLIVLLSTMQAAALDSLGLEARSDKAAYLPGDTAIVVVSIDIPRGFSLYANPKGPGIGEPLTLTPPPITGLQWLELRASPPQRYEPDAGEWVWGYKRSATLFALAIIDEKARDTLQGSFELQGVICDRSCILISQRLPFALAIDKDANEKRFDNAFFARFRFTQAKPMPFGNERLPPIVMHSGGGSPQASAQSVTPLADPLPQPVSGFVDAGVVQTLPPWDYSPQEQTPSFNLALALLFGFVAGLILNVMPCVLPVLGLKVLGLVREGQRSPGQRLLHASVFCGGIVSVFMVLAALAAFANFSWGEQFQRPAALIGIIVAVVLFGLGLLDFFTLPALGVPGATQAMRAQGLWGDFVRGVFTTLLATPCSGPFLGATLAWTLLQPPGVIFAVFFAIGVGMGLPYVVLTMSRGLWVFVPRPGRWMDDVRHAMAFVLFGFAVWLLMGLSQALVVGTVGFCLCVVGVVALAGRLGGGRVVKGGALLFAAALVALLACGGYCCFVLLPRFTSIERVEQGAVESGRWRTFDPFSLTDAHLQGRHVVVDFTARWCMNCQYNKLAVLDAPDIAALLAQKNVLCLSADITTKNPPAQSLLAHLGGQSVPFLAIFRGDDPYNPIILRDVLSRGQMVKVLADLPDK
jgi:thiol:disulfide interchange protein DsbD